MQPNVLNTALLGGWLMRQVHALQQVWATVKQREQDRRFWALAQQDARLMVDLRAAYDRAQASELSEDALLPLAAQSPVVVSPAPREANDTPAMAWLRTARGVVHYV